jgi:ABC-type bacteriocin/lantibiotic exporter with double-glycine peptidase domain
MNSQPGTHLIRRNRQVHDALHPSVYRTIIGLTIWLVLSVWLFFNRGPFVGLDLAIVTVFFVIAVGIPLLLSASSSPSTQRSPAVSGDFI